MPLRIKGNNAIVTRAMTPSLQRQGRLCINNGNDAIIIRVKIAIATMAKNPAHQWQQRHCKVGDNTSSMISGEGGNTSLTTAETRLRINNSDGAIVMRTTIALQQQQRCLRIDGGDASLPTSNKGDDINDDNNAIVMRATTPA
jgi:hypothetical protein